MQPFFQELLAELARTRELLIVALILARTMPMVMLTPFLAGKLAPTEIKIALGLLFAVLLWPIARGAVVLSDVPMAAAPFFVLMIKEAAVGFAIGFVNVHIFYAMEMAGRIIDTVRGSSMAEVMDPHSRRRATPFGDLYFQMMVVVFVVSGGHHIFIEAYFYSFAAIPLTQAFPHGVGLFAFVDFLMHFTAQVIFIAAVLAAPIVAATLISDVVFGILNRVAPQLNAYFMSMPVKAMGGVIMALVILEPFVVRLFDLVVTSLQGMEKAIDLLAGGS